MVVHARDVVPGEFFMTHDGELRKVSRLATDAQGRALVWYQCKPTTLPTQPLLFGHTAANPPLLDDFAAQCAYRLSEPELRTLREQSVLLEDE